MEIDELLDYLGIENASEFCFFEHLADLIECDRHIPYDTFYAMLAHVPAETLIDMTDNYFEDIQTGLPDDSIDFFTLLDTIKQSLLGLAQNSDERESKVLYADELYRFRHWYYFDSIVSCRALSGGEYKEMPICEALLLSRLEKLGGEEYGYDFSKCLDFEVSEYALSFSAAIDVDEPEEESRYDDTVEDEELYEKGLIDRSNPVIDGENYESEEATNRIH